MRISATCNSGYQRSTTATTLQYGNPSKIPNLWWCRLDIAGRCGLDIAENTLFV
ncbi:hypothetical protein HanIR_Chr05g0215311 [Helianthus annuus]|nr:hypothetical protein HanIR_Chr05g0215311 [Helianthus annuus]